MKKDAVIRSIGWLMLTLGVLSLCVFAASLGHDWYADDMEWFEKVARIAGYVLVLTANAFTVKSLMRIDRDGLCNALYGRYAKTALGASFASLALMCVHDILLYMAYGNQLEGTFTMVAFFALDAALLTAYITLYLSLKKRRDLARVRGLLAAIAMLWAVYIVGDMAGYPASHLFDWDEAIMKFSLMCGACVFAVLLEPKSGRRAPYAKA